jgi:hypothetical protein
MKRHVAFGKGRSGCAMRAPAGAVLPGPPGLHNDSLYRAGSLRRYESLPRGVMIVDAGPAFSSGYSAFPSVFSPR